MARILVVDDEVSIVHVLTALLTGEGYDVVSTRDSAKALEWVRAEAFDLVVTDVRMSPVDGIELLRTVRRERPDTAVIMLTAYGNIHAARDAIKMGAFDYVAKPFKVDELLVTVQRALASKSPKTDAEPPAEKG